MVEKAVVGRELSEEMIQAGAELLRSLDKNGVVVRAALWFLLTDADTWRLIIASPEVRHQGPKSMYRRVQSIVNRLPEDEPRLRLENISVVDDREPLISLLSTAIQTGDGVSGIRFSRNTVNGVFIEDAYIYRMM